MHSDVKIRFYVLCTTRKEIVENVIGQPSTFTFAFLSSSDIKLHQWSRRALLGQHPYTGYLVECRRPEIPTGIHGLERLVCGVSHSSCEGTLREKGSNVNQMKVMKKQKQYEQ